MKSFNAKMIAIATALPLAAIAGPAMAGSAATGDKSASMAPYAPITEAEVIAAQNNWCNALVAIATENDTKGQAAAKTLAQKVIDSAYAYNMGPVLFKPTLANGAHTFRTTANGALAYFVGGDPTFKGDTGFALKGWRNCKSENAAIAITGNTAMSMGNVSMWDSKGKMTMVDKTWGYVRGADGTLRIILHHSSLPYSAS